MRYFQALAASLFLAKVVLSGGVEQLLNPPDYLPPPTKAEKWEAEENRLIQEIGDDIERLSQQLKRDLEESDREIQRIQLEFELRQEKIELESKRPRTPEEEKETLRELDKLWEEAPVPKEEKKPERHRPIQRGEKFA